MATDHRPDSVTGGQEIAQTTLIMPNASRRCSEVPIVSNRAVTSEQALVEFSITPNGQAPGRESQYRMPDPILLTVFERPAINNVWHAICRFNPVEGRLYFILLRNKAISLPDAGQISMTRSK
jgi:hypothetical protein